MKVALEGGCLCGAVRFRAETSPIWIARCHCQSCRKHTGAPVSVFVAIEEVAVRVTRGGSPSSGPLRAPSVASVAPAARRSPAKATCGRANCTSTSARSTAQRSLRRASTSSLKRGCRGYVLRNLRRAGKRSQSRGRSPSVDAPFSASVDSG
jgi:hypothetical protein